MTLRTRLALASLALLALCLSAFGAGVYVYVRAELHQGFDDSLRDTVTNLEALLRTIRADNQSEAEENVKRTLDSAELPDTLAWATETSPQEGNIYKSKTIPQETYPPQVPFDQIVAGGIRVPSGVSGERAAGEPDYNRLAFLAVPFEVSRHTQEAERADQRGGRESVVLEGVLTVARPVETVEGPLRLLRTILIGGGLLALVAATLLGLGTTSALLRPLERMRVAAQRIGGERDFHLRLPVGDPKHELGRLAVTMNQTLGELEQAHGSLQATLEAQRRFVADASHELRTPVTAIRTNVEFLERAPNARHQDRREALADVLSEVHRMEQLVGDLLALARLEAAARHDHHALRLDHLLGDVHRDTARQAPAGVDVVLDPPPEVWIAGDRGDLRRALWNLAENALKYLRPGTAVPLDQEANGEPPRARPGAVAFSLEVADGLAIVRVRDTGIGIAAADLPYVFDRFWRAPAVRGRSGSGLGLAITKWVAQAHGGTVEVVSVPGTGTTFTIRLPVLELPEATTVAPPETPAQAPVRDAVPAGGQPRPVPRHS